MVHYHQNLHGNLKNFFSLMHQSKSWSLYKILSKKNLIYDITKILEDAILLRLKNNKINYGLN
jgi:hypothetical protein